MMLSRLFLLGLCATLAFTGCSGEGRAIPDTVPVSGTITLDGKPLADAEINFLPESHKDFASYGKTNAEGKYTLVQGAVPGKNKIVIKKMSAGNLQINPEEGMDAGQMEAMASAAQAEGKTGPQVPKQLVPADYSDPTKSKLEFPVPEDGTDKADFKL